MHTKTVKKSAGFFFVIIFILSVLIGLPCVTETFFILSGVIFCVALGLADDIWNLRSSTKLIFEFLFFLPFSFYFCQNIKIFGMDLQSVGHIAPVLASVYFVFVINLCNFMDGIDIYLTLTFFIALANLFLLSNQRSHTEYLILFSASLLGFAILNFPPAKLFMGDSGSLPIGFLIASMPFLFGDRESTDLSLSFLLIPIFWTDGVITLLNRTLERKNVLVAHKEHSYQRITISLLSKRNTAILFGLLNLMGVGLYLILRPYLRTEVITLILLCFYTGLFFFANGMINKRLSS